MPRSGSRHPGDVHVQRLGRAEPVLVPDLGHDALPPHHATGLGDEQREEVELLGGQLELSVAPPGAACADVHADRLGGDRVGDAAPQEGADPGEELGEPERLGDVVVGARVEAGDDVELIALGGEHEDRGARADGSDPATDLQSIDTGQPDVEDEQVVLPGERLPHRLVAVRDPVNLVPLTAQGPHEGLHDSLVVLGEEQSHWAIVGSGGPPRRPLGTSFARSLPGGVRRVTTAPRH